MANKWKYSTLPASERLEKIRNGDKDVYNSEIERSLDVIKQREEAGLDVTEQKNWMNRLDYNYGQSKKQKQRNKPISISYKKIAAQEKANELTKDYYAKVKATEDEENYLKEWLLNNGIDENSKAGMEYLEEFRVEARERIDKYLNQYKNSLNKLLDQFR